MISLQFRTKKKLLLENAFTNSPKYFINRKNYVKPLIEIHIKTSEFKLLYRFEIFLYSTIPLLEVENRGIVQNSNYVEFLVFYINIFADFTSGACPNRSEYCPKFHELNQSGL